MKVTIDCKLNDSIDLRQLFQSMKYNTNRCPHQFAFVCKLITNRHDLVVPCSLYIGSNGDLMCNFAVDIFVLLSFIASYIWLHDKKSYSAIGLNSSCSCPEKYYSSVSRRTHTTHTHTYEFGKLIYNWPLPSNHTRLCSLSTRSLHSTLCTLFALPLVVLRGAKF